MKIDYKELLKKYIRHVGYHEGMDYLSEIRICDSGCFTEYDKDEMIILKNEIFGK